MGGKINIALSGGFDPLHLGHLKMIQDASRFGQVMIFLNSDKWLMKKKGYVFMDFQHREAILMALKDVELVIPAEDEDGTVIKSILEYKDHIMAFGNGGDRGTANTPEVELCRKLEIPLIFGLGGNVPIHSSELINRVRAS